jgi:hypothetical protein
MERADAIKILAVLKAAYPHSFTSLTVKDANAMIDLWASMFAEESYETVNVAVAALISTRTVGYSPTVGEVKEQLQSLKSSKALSEQAAWALVSRACENGIYGYRKEFAKLPPEVQRAVGAPEQLREWAKMDADTVQSVVASNFMRNYRAQQSREKEVSMLPPAVRSVIGGIAEGMKLIDE